MTPIKIAPPCPREDGKIISGVGTKVYSDGREVKGVQCISVKICADSFTEVELTVSADLEETWALPFMSEESFLAAAKRYGYEVKKR